MCPFMTLRAAEELISHVHQAPGPLLPEHHLSRAFDTEQFRLRVKSYLPNLVVMVRTQGLELRIPGLSHHFTSPSNHAETSMWHLLTVVTHSA